MAILTGRLFKGVDMCDIWGRSRVLTEAFVDAVTSFRASFNNRAALWLSGSEYFQLDNYDSVEVVCNNI
jgi:hypothetical protein